MMSMSNDDASNRKCYKYGINRIKKTERLLRRAYCSTAVAKKDYPPESILTGSDLEQRSFDHYDPERTVIINLPAYIVNSHNLARTSKNDISRQYNLQLRTPDEQNLYVTDHHILLQVMSQYVYYRKLCIWIKDELKKKRLELLEAARKALIDARDGADDICNCDPNNAESASPERNLTDIERQFLQKLVEGPEDLSSLYIPQRTLLANYAMPTIVPKQTVTVEKKPSIIKQKCNAKATVADEQTNVKEKLSILKCTVQEHHLRNCTAETQSVKEHMVSRSSMAESTCPRGTPIQRSVTQDSIAVIAFPTPKSSVGSQKTAISASSVPTRQTFTCEPHMNTRLTVCAPPSVVYNPQTVPEQEYDIESESEKKTSRCCIIL